MSSTKSYLRNFSGGEISPELAGRLELQKFQTGLSLCRNFMVLPHGPVARRPGFEFMAEAKDSTRPVRLIPFAFNATQTAVLQFGHQYIRFHINGGALLEGTVAISSISGNTVETSAAHGYSDGDWVFIGNRFHVVTVVDTDTFTTTDTWGENTTAAGTTAARVYTIASPYDEADLFDLHYTQSADVITIVHPDYPAKELKRLGATDWTLTDVTFAPPLSPPTGISVAVDSSAGTSNRESQWYKVTAVGSDGVSESLPSATASGYNNLTLAGNKNTVTWTGLSGIDRYNVYKRRGGLFGYIGQATPLPTTSVNISSGTRGSPPFAKTKQVVINTATPHGYSTGAYVLVSGTGAPAVDGYWNITVTDADTFTYTCNKEGLSIFSTGTVSTPALSVVDDNILPDTSQTPPDETIFLNGESGDYPGATTYFEQRRWFAGSANKPQVLWATRNGTESNLTSSIPARDADGLEVRVASMQNNQVRHLVPLVDLIALTGGGEFRIYADSAPSITPTSITIKPQGYTGASNTQPIVTTGSVIFVQAQGAHVFELAYGSEKLDYGYQTLDISILSPHRFDGYTITQLAFSRSPYPTVWAVRSDGVLLGMTYLPEHTISAWHAHDTAGAVESVCVVAEGNEDVLYIGVVREVDGRTVRYIERLHSPFFAEQADAFYVDSGLSYTGSPVTTLSGLWHLEGCEVDVLADGSVEPRKTVTNGQITLAVAASKIHVGLPITADIATLPLAIEGMAAAGQGTAKNVNKVHLHVRRSSVVKAGPSFDRLREYPARAVSDPYGSPPALRDGELSLAIDPSWGQSGYVCVRQDLPLPLTVLAMTLEVVLGG